VRQGSLNTQLNPLDEIMFRKWVTTNNVPFDPNAPPSDYDMRGFWQGLQQQNPRAFSAVDPYDKRLHYTDYYKNPSHETFSNQSRFGAGAQSADVVNSIMRAIWASQGR
jgi:hypothetical protein